MCPPLGVTTTRIVTTLSRGFGGLVLGALGAVLNREPGSVLTGQPPTSLLIVALMTGVVIMVVTLARALARD